MLFFRFVPFLIWLWKISSECLYFVVRFNRTEIKQKFRLWSLQQYACFSGTAELHFSCWSLWPLPNTNCTLPSEKPADEDLLGPQKFTHNENDKTQSDSCHLNLVASLGANTMCVWVRWVTDSFQGEAAAFLFVGKQSTDQDLKCSIYF